MAKPKLGNLISYFGDLVPASQILSDWIVWMEETSGRCRGSIARDTPLHSSSGDFPFTGASFGEDGDDGALLNAITFLHEIVVPIRSVIGKWAQRMTVPDGQLFDSTLFQFTGTVEPWGSAAIAALLEPATSLPTAHENASSWLERFLGIADRYLRITNDANAQTEIASAHHLLPSLFLSVDWNCLASAELLAGMEKERRKLHGDTCTSGDQIDSFAAVWYPERTLDTDILAHHADMVRCILGTLAKHDQLKRDELYSEAWLSGHKGKPSGAFGEAISSLSDLHLIRGGRGGKSEGYCITIRGRRLAQQLSNSR